MLWSILPNVRDYVLLKSDRRLSQQPAIRRCASFHGDLRLGQYCSFRVRGCSNNDTAGSLPEDVLGQCAATQDHLGCGSLGKSSGNLEDPHAVRWTRKGDIFRYANVAGPFVKARSQGQSANLSSAQVDRTGVRPSGGVGVGSLQVTYGCRQERGASERQVLRHDVS